MILKFTFIYSHFFCAGRRSSVGIAIRCWLGYPVIESRSGARFPAPAQTGPGAHPASYTLGTGSFPGVKSGRGVTLPPHPLLVLWSRKSRAIPLLPLWAVQPVQSLSACTTVHCNFTYTSTPPMAVQPIHSLSACTTVHFTFTYTSNPPMAVQPVQSLSACTTVHFTFTYTSTPPTGRTAFTEPQCLYNGALYLYLYLSSPYGPYGLYRA